MFVGKGGKDSLCGGGGEDRVGKGGAGRFILRTPSKVQMEAQDFVLGTS